ncbi:4-hydroxyphenylpyruvate dioxygenase [Kitasatospora sp. NPDC036755]|uniref:4-hydroxyphenylpyruvate dioxygenase n=1 Tax=Kitasatospora sp. NPDC036755 TaxID=3154600 RepID=UPI0033F233F7
MTSLPANGFQADLDLDHVVLYVTDLEAAGARFTEHYCFTPVGTADSTEAGARSVALRQGRVLLVLTQGTIEDHPATAYTLAHGDGVGDIVLRTPDVTKAFRTAVAQGARPIAEPRPLPDGTGLTAVVGGFGDIVHSLLERHPADPPALPPGFRPLPAAPGHTAEVGLLDFDHFAVCVGPGELNATVALYRDALGFEQTFEEQIRIGSQAMNSKVVQNASRTVTLTVLEPDTSAEPGQIDEFVKKHGGSGVQHLAFLVDDAVRSVRALSRHGVEFLDTPGSYYDLLRDRIEVTTHTVDELRALNVLVDQDHAGQLFQIFTRSTHPRRTLFFEVIERIGAETFGSSNIRALYEAVEFERSRHAE